MAEERQKMGQVLPFYSLLIPFADFALGYADAEDGRAYLDHSVENTQWSDEMRRFAGFRFFESGDLDFVPLLLGGTSVQLPEDHLASAMAMVLDENFEVATEILTDMAQTEWEWLGPVQLAINIRLYEIIANHRNLSADEQLHVAKLQSQLRESGQPTAGIRLDSSAFCH